MASLSELFDLTQNQTLKERVAAAVILAAIDNIDNADATIKAWCGKALRGGLGEIGPVVLLFLGTQRDRTRTEILETTDADMKSVVAALVPGLAASND